MAQHLEAEPPASLSAAASALSELSITSEPTPRLDGLELPTLDKFPLETLRHIATYLSPISKALFALTCRRIYQGLDTDYIQYLKEKSNVYDRQNFLEFLEADLPHYISCCRCHVLHPVKALIPSRQVSCAGYHNACKPYYDHPSCDNFDSELKELTGMHSNFSHVDFQKVMKLHRTGRDTTELLEKLSLKPLTEQRDGYVNQTSAVAQIMNGSLVIRQQSIWLRRKRRGPLTRGAWRVNDIICPHYRISSIETKKVCLSDERIDSGYAKKCDSCFTEFRIDEKEYDWQRSVLFVTQWLDLGKGQLYRDQKWQSRTDMRNQPVSDSYKRRHRDGRPPLAMNLQFEDKKDWQSLIDSILTLAPEDEAALLDEKYGKKSNPRKRRQ